MLPVISVLMVTYNHEKFIERAIKSVMNQQGEIACELVIGEDASTDNTAEIIRRLQQLYPDKIFPVFHPKNVGMTANFYDALSRCRGKYIAWLDGDDEWTNLRKLQIQYNFMERNPDVVLCGGNAVSRGDGLFFKISTVIKKWTNFRRKITFLTGSEVMVLNRFRALTVMFRNPFENAPKVSTASPVLDWPFYSGLGIDKLYVNLPDILATYTVHPGGVYSMKSYSDRLAMVARTREEMLKVYNNRYIGWYLPLLWLYKGNPGREELIKEFCKTYKNLLQNYSEIATVDNLPDFYEVFLKVTSIEELGCVFGICYLKAKDFDSFTEVVSHIMKRIKQMSLQNTKKDSYLRSLAAAWSSILFFSSIEFKTVRLFITSPLRHYIDLHWVTVFRIYKKRYLSQ